jgi:hypothetical protein
MGNLNRTKDASEQRIVLSTKAGATATGVTGIIANVPSACVVEGGMLAAFGLSGAPTVAVVANRFIVGAGATAITIATGTSNVVQAFGTSGIVSTGILFGASTVLLPNDVLMFVTGAANTAVTGLSVDIVVRPLQDVVTRFGVI